MFKDEFPIALRFPFRNQIVLEFQYFGIHIKYLDLQIVVI